MRHDGTDGGTGLRKCTMATNGTVRQWPYVIAAVAGLVSLMAAIPELNAASGASQRRPSIQDYTSGPYLFRTFCASCHGADGRGQGPVADTLRTRPPDLTTIALRRGGTFPADDVHASIDGRRPVPGHGSREMPVWGDVLRSTEGQDDATIKRRIDALVQYLQSLQAK